MTKEECLAKASVACGYSNDAYFAFIDNPRLLEVALKAMQYAQIACLERAAENAQLMEISYGTDDDRRLTIDKSSITDPKNLI